MESATLERLQQLPADDELELEYMLCSVTCYLSCLFTHNPTECNVTSTVT